MNKTTSGWVILLAALGMMAGLISNDIAKLTEWGQVLSPSFIALLMSHFAVVVLAFIGGKIIPEERNGQYTRSSDNGVRP